MYATTLDVQIDSYPDLRRKERYRVDLTADMPCDLEDVGTALQQSGYYIVDADQRGRTYHHRQNPGCIAELDESEEAGKYVRLLLRNGDLDEPDIDQAKDQLASLYDRINQMCHARYEQDDFDWLYYSEDLEVEVYQPPDTERYKIKD